MQGKAGGYASVFEKYQEKAESFMCNSLGKGSKNVQKTPGGLIFRQRWNNMQFVTSASFLTAVYSDYLSSAGRNMNCASGNVSPTELISFSKQQVIQSYCANSTLFLLNWGFDYITSNKDLHKLTLHKNVLSSYVKHIIDVMQC